MKIYIAGPMTGYVDFNFPAFDAAAELLISQGHVVFNPADRDRSAHGEDFAKGTTGDHSEVPEFSLRDALAADTEWICQHAQAIYLLDGWEKSKGANAEKALAVALGHAILYQTPPSDEVRSVSATGGEKGTKLARFDLIPTGPLTALAEHYGRGSAKYADRNWERGYEWSKSFAALQRHAWAFWSGEDTDAETGSPHLAAVAWHAFAMLEFSNRYPDFDDRP